MEGPGSTLNWITVKNGHGWSKEGKGWDGDDEACAQEKERERLSSWWDSKNREHREKDEMNLRKVKRKIEEIEAIFIERISTKISSLCVRVPFSTFLRHKQFAPWCEQLKFNLMIQWRYNANNFMSLWFLNNKTFWVKIMRLHYY